MCIKFHLYTGFCLEEWRNHFKENCLGLFFVFTTCNHIRCHKDDAIHNMLTTFYLHTYMLPLASFEEVIVQKIA